MKITLQRKMFLKSNAFFSVCQPRKTTIVLFWRECLRPEGTDIDPEAKARRGAQVPGLSPSPSEALCDNQGQLLSFAWGPWVDTTKGNQFGIYVKIPTG